MEAVDAMISVGLLQIRDAMVLYTEKLDPNANTNSLAIADVPWTLDWERYQISITNVIERTAHERFQRWYTNSFRGTKRSIEDVDYVPQAAPTDPTPSDPTPSHSSSGLSTLQVPSRASPPLTRSRSRATKRRGL